MRRRAALRLARVAASVFVPASLWGAATVAGAPGGAAPAPGPASGRELRVDPTRGDDGSVAGPFRTIARAIAAARPGDTIHLAPGRYRQSAAFHDRCGAPGRPITLDGHGATLDGGEPLRPADWSMAAPGLYSNRRLLRVSPAVLGRWFFVFDTRMNRMGRTSKGPKAPLKKPEELAPGEWTYVPDEPAAGAPEPGRSPDARRVEGAFHIRIAPGTTLDAQRIVAPIRANGVSLSGCCAHLVIRNVTSTHVYNDGFNIHGHCHDVLFENIRAIDCGDDGISAHETAQYRVEGLVSTGNSTGICDVGAANTRYNRVFIANCSGVDLYFLNNGRYHLGNALVRSSAQIPFLLTAAEGERCELEIDNVLLHRLGPPDPARTTPSTLLKARRFTLENIGLDARGELALDNCVINGRPSAAGATGADRVELEKLAPRDLHP